MSDSPIFLREGADVLYDGSGEPDYGFPDAETELTSFPQDLGSGLGPCYSYTEIALNVISVIECTKTKCM